MQVHQHGKNMLSVEHLGREWFISYKTVVAYRDGQHRVRRNHTFSKTTAKHMTQMGVKDWQQVNDEDFARITR